MSPAVRHATDNLNKEGCSLSDNGSDRNCDSTVWWCFAENNDENVCQDTAARTYLIVWILDGWNMRQKQVLATYAEIRYPLWEPGLTHSLERRIMV